MAVYLWGTASIFPQSCRSLSKIIPSRLASTSVPSTTAFVPTPSGTLRPHLQVPVNPNHGLYGFFRKKTDKNSHTKPSDGQPEYVSIEPPPSVLSGRAWEAPELRRKSFKDLHTLWYILLRERNLLATQAAERVRIKGMPFTDLSPKPKAMLCRKSMARIKAVINERRLAYTQALRLRRFLRRNPKLGGPTSVGKGAADDILESGEDDVVIAKP